MGSQATGCLGEQSLLRGEGGELLFRWSRKERRTQCFASHFSRTSRNVGGV
nr:MAG TPA: hypothetical protein [Microviridae sp.]